MTVLEETKKQGIPLRLVGELSHYFQGSVAAPSINGPGLPIVSVPVHPSPEVHIMRLYTGFPSSQACPRTRNRAWVQDTATTVQVNATT